MNIIMRAPATLNAATSVVLPDGTTTTVDANRYAAVDSKHRAALEGAGWDYVDAPNDYLPLTAYTDMADTAAANVLPAALLGQDVTIDMAGTLTAGATLTLPTVAALVAAINAVTKFNVNMRIKLRVVNSGAGAFAWTVTTNTGWTPNGTHTVAQGAVRDYYISFQSETAATFTSRNG